MSTDDATAPVFRGVNFSSNGSYFRLTSTDGKELARYNREIDLPIFDQVITANVVSNLTKNVDPTTDVFFYFQDGKFYVRTGHLDIMGSTIVADYPNVDTILAAENYNHFLVSKIVLQDSILNIMPNVDTKSNRINLIMKDGELTIQGIYSNETINVGIKVYDFDGEFSFDCNGWYLHRAISKVESDTVKILFRQEEEPIIIKDNTDQPFDLTTLLVPMRRF
jgi:DNA polymerase III sliding clamp (beta) subunit (PCNA family)